MNVCSAVHVFGLDRFRESVPDAPPSSCPIVPEYESDEPIVGVDVDTVFSVPLLFVVYVTPLDVRLDRFVMF